jgi:hypothetical protein
MLALAPPIAVHERCDKCNRDFVVEDGELRLDAAECRFRLCPECLETLVAYQASVSSDWCPRFGPGPRKPKVAAAAPRTR